ncbi:MAG: repeat protein [bacterium]|nr:repeat protein [bacterium]
MVIKFKRTPRRSRRLDDRWTVELPDFAEAKAWSPDGESLAVATLAGTVLVLDGESGKELAKGEAHKGGAMAIAFSPDGTRLVSGGQDGTIASWTRDGEREQTQFGGGTWVDHIIWSPEGDCLATAAGRIVRVWTPELDLVAEVTGYESTISSMFWLPETTQIVTSCYGGLQFLEVGAHEWARHLDWKGSILTAAASPDGRFIAAGNQDASVHVWNSRTGRDLRMSGYHTKVRELAWSPRGDLLATGGSDAITLWSFAGRGPAGSKPDVLHGHQGRVTGLGFTTDGRLISCGDDGGLIEWRRAGKSFTLAKIRETEAPLFSLALSSDGAKVAVATGDSEVTVWPL